MPYSEGCNSLSLTETVCEIKADDYDNEMTSIEHC